MKRIAFCLIVALALTISACAPAPTATPAPTPDLGAVETQAVQDAYAALTAGAPTGTPPPPAGTPDPALPVAVVPTSTPGQPAGVALYNTAIMSGPGTAYVFYAGLLGGASVQVVGVSEDSQWWVISVPPAPLGQGWVSAAYLSTADTQDVPVVVTPPVPPTTDMVPPGPSDPQATALSNVYVRNGPGAEYPAYGIAPSGTSGRVIGVSEDRAWWAVRLDPTKVGAGYGWVMAQYTTSSNTADVPVIQNPQTAAVVVPPPSGTPTPPPAGSASAQATDWVNIRTGPSTYYPILGVAPPGATAPITGKSSDSGWWQVQIPTQYAASGLGWVSASYTIAYNADSVPVATAPPPPPTVAPTAPPASPSVACQLVSQSPADGTTISIGQPFTTTWVLKNTGSAAWTTSSFDIAFIGALNNVWLHTGPDVYDLSTNVDPGQTYNFSVPMLAPNGPGDAGEAWEIHDANGVIACQFYVYVTVP